MKILIGQRTCVFARRTCSKLHFFYYYYYYYYYYLFIYLFIFFHMAGSFIDSSRDKQSRNILAQTQIHPRIHAFMPTHAFHVYCCLILDIIIVCGDVRGRGGGGGEGFTDSVTLSMLGKLFCDHCSSRTLSVLVFILMSFNVSHL